MGSAQQPRRLDRPVHRDLRSMAGVLDLMGPDDEKAAHLTSKLRRMLDKRLERRRKRADTSADFLAQSPGSRPDWLNS